jgi:menaquinone-dependent protoporphyrinogen oxidase
MKTLIVYATHHGCTEECAGRLRAGLDGEVKLVRLPARTPPDLVTCDRVLVGGSIQIGKIQGSVRRFCREHLQLLLSKPLGLFICCMAEGADAQREFDEAFPDVLRRHARASGMFGGVFAFEKMNPLQRAVMHRISGERTSVDRLRPEAIEAFIAKLRS